MTKEEFDAWMDSPEGEAFNEAVIRASLVLFRKRTSEEIRDEWRLD